MPKKRIQHKGKPKHTTEENEELVFRKNSNENADEEYTTVVDFEVNKKYNKRLVQNNWSKYEASLSDFECGDEEIGSPKTDDFNDLLRIASSDCSHFQLSSEKLWKSEHNSVAASKIFNLDLNILSKGLACVPFYERMALDVSELTVEEKESFDTAAEHSWKQYNLERKQLIKRIDDWKLRNLENDSKTFKDSIKAKSNLEESKKNQETDESSGMSEVRQQADKNTKEEKISENNQCSDFEVEGLKKKNSFSGNDENLEDWLDSVLND